MACIQPQDAGWTGRDKENQRMIKLLIHWLLSAVVLMVIAHFVPGFHVANLQAALIAALVIGLLNATLGFFLKIITFPITSPLACFCW
jgi:uncharacterized membrane protein YvlD (DUF360 family)